MATRDKKQKLNKSFSRLSWASQGGAFILGISIGILLAAYLIEYDWILIGWILLAISIIIQVPLGYGWFKLEKIME